MRLRNFLKMMLAAALFAVLPAGAATASVSCRPVSPVAGEPFELRITVDSDRDFRPELPEIAPNARAGRELEKARTALEAAAKQFADGNYELAAEESARAAHAVGVIVGRHADPDLLDEVFKNFCIGK